MTLRRLIGATTASVMIAAGEAQNPILDQNIKAVTQLMERAKQAELDKAEYEKAKTDITQLTNDINICKQTSTANKGELVAKTREVTEYKEKYFTAQSSLEATQTSLSTTKVLLKEKSVEASEFKNAQADAYRYGEQNKEYKAELNKVRKDGELLVVEVSLRMKHEAAAKKCSVQLADMTQRMEESGETRERRLKAEAVAFGALQRAQEAEDKLAQEKKEQELREDEIKKNFTQRFEAAKVESEAQLTQAGVDLKNVETTKGELEKQIKKLETKGDLWKSMADFLQRDLERVKTHSLRIENAYQKAKETQLKNTEKERSNTESELDRLKTSINLIKTSATKNSQDAQEAVKVQQAAKITAQEENRALKKALIELKTQHIEMSSQWRANQKDLSEKLQLAEALSMKKMNTLMLGLKYQKEKANQAAFKVTELKGALVEYEKVNAEPISIDMKILNPMMSADSISSLEIISLPQINLSEGAVGSIDTDGMDQSEGKAYEKLSAKESAELQQAEEWMTRAQASASAEFISDSQIEAERAATTKEIQAERSRVITFMANVKARFNRFKQAYQMNRITRQQLEKVQKWAKNKEIHARNGFTQFQKKAAAKLMNKLNVNQRVQDKLSKALKTSQELQSSIKQKYSDKRSAMGKISLNPAYSV